MGNIEWIPIADIPDALKDGREVLLWLHGHGGFPALGSWADGGGWYVDDNPSPVIDSVTHIAEISAPR